MHISRAAVESDADSLLSPRTINLNAVSPSISKTKALHIYALNDCRLAVRQTTAQPPLSLEPRGTPAPDGRGEPPYR